MIALLAGPAAKILGAGIGIVALFGAGVWWGYDQCETKHKASIMEQALEANENMMKANENIARVHRELAITMERLVRKENNAIEIKERYETSNEQKFIIGHQLELAVNALSELHNATADRVPAPSAPPGGSPEPQKTVATSAALLRAYGSCTSQLDELYDAYYHPIVDAYRTSREIALEGAGY